MKKTKKMLALVLAMVMAFAMMAVTASAFDAEEHNHECAACCEDEGIMPLGPVGPAGPPCIVCGAPTERVSTTDLSGQIYYYYRCTAGCGE